MNSTEALYNQRLARYATAMKRGIPDRVPTRPFVAEFCAKHASMTCQDVAHDNNKAYTAEAGYGRSSLMHIGNIAMELGRRLRWDPQADAFLRYDRTDEQRSRPARDWQA